MIREYSVWDNPCFVAIVVKIVSVLSCLGIWKLIETAIAIFKSVDVVVK